MTDDEIDYFDVISDMAHYLEEKCDAREEQIVTILVRESHKVGLERKGFNEKAIKCASHYDIDHGMQLFKRDGDFKDYTKLVERILKSCMYLGIDQDQQDMLRSDLLKIVRKHISTMLMDGL